MKLDVVRTDGTVGITPSGAGSSGEFFLKKDTVEALMYEYPLSKTGIREDFERLSKQVLSLGIAHDALVDTVKVNSKGFDSQLNTCRTELNTLQEQIEESPGNWKVSKDISRLTDRIEKLEELLQSGKNVTVHSRLNDMEKEIKDQREDYHAHFRGVREDEIAKLETCCKNVVASGKALEERIDRVDKNMNILSIEVSDASKRTQRADKFMDKLRNL